MNLEEKLFTKLFMNQATVLEKKQIAKRTIHFKLGGGFRFKNIIPGQHLRLLLLPNHPGKLRDRVRTYSIWDYQQNEEDHTIDIAICTHSDGPGSKWAKRANIGEPILISNPLGKFTLDRHQKKHLFIGDLSALTHFYCFVHHSTPQQRIQGIFYGEDENEFFPNFDHSNTFIFHKVTPGTEASLLQYCRNLKIDPDTTIYIGGEGNMCIALYQLFVKELNFTRKRLKVKPFWMPGKTGLE